MAADTRASVRMKAKRFFEENAFKKCCIQYDSHFVEAKCMKLWDDLHCSLGPISILRPSFPGVGIPTLKIRWSWDRLIFKHGDPYTGKTTSLYWNSLLHSNKPIITYLLFLAQQLLPLLPHILIFRFVVIMMPVPESPWKFHGELKLVAVQQHCIASLGQNGWHFCRRHFQIHFLERNILVLIQISLKFVLKGTIRGK